MTRQNRSSAVMAQRKEAPDSLDYFPTPPWATRALCTWLAAIHLEVDRMPVTTSCWEPACGEGHMARPLREYFGEVYASDVRDYGDGNAVADFLLPYTYPPHLVDTPPGWVITNPPFRLAAQFALRALDVAREGVALLVRTAFLEGGDRYETLFRPHPPTAILQFCERVAMVKGRVDEKAQSATAYCWLVWDCRAPARVPPEFFWNPPGTRKALERPGDYPPPDAAPDPGDDRATLF